MKDGPTARVLRVLDTVSKYGPANLAQICEKCTFSRAAVWRALSVLRELGWVRMRLGDNAFIVTHEKVTSLAAGRSSLVGASSVAEAMARLEQQLSAHLCLAGFRPDGGFEVIESTSSADYQKMRYSMLDDGIILAAQLALDRTSLVKILRDYVLECSISDRVLSQIFLSFSSVRNGAIVCGQP